MDLTLFRQEIAKGLTALESAIERLIVALSHCPITATVEATGAERSAIRRVCDAYSTIDYRMEDDVCLGLAGVNA